MPEQRKKRSIAKKNDAWNFNQKIVKLAKAIF